jgi:hypothetical protein
MGAMAGLAICQYDGEDAFYLFDCDADWQTVTDTFEEMLCCLQELRVRRGDLPSILGTLADYTDDGVERYDLYARGVAEAQRLGDGKNLMILLESILELDCLDGDPRAFWESQLNGVKIEPSAAPNGGPATRLGTSGVTDGPHPVA